MRLTGNKPRSDQTGGLSLPAAGHAGIDPGSGAGLPGSARWAGIRDRGGLPDSGRYVGRLPFTWQALVARSPPCPIVSRARTRE